MHAASDGSFGRSAAGSTARGVVLLVVALGLGILLLQSTDRSPTLTTTQSASPTTTPPTTAAPAAAPPTTLPPTHDPKTVKVLAANGSTVNGLALKTKNKIQAAGYDALSPLTATSKVTASQVFYTAGYQADAVALAAALGLPPTSVQPMPAKVPVPGVVTANIVVVAGPDMVPLVAGTTTTTTVRRTTATTAKAAATTTTVAHTSSSSTPSSSTPSSTSTTKP